MVRWDYPDSSYFSHLEGNRSKLRLNLLLAFLITAFNIALNFRMFLPGVSPYRGSIEPGYVFMARFFSQHPNPWAWSPLQYCGLPAQFIYLPLLPYFTALWIWILPWLDPAQIYRVIVYLTACLSPAAVFLFVRTFTGTRPNAFGAAILVSILSPLYELIGAIDQDRGFMQIPWRLQVLVKYGEGPHTVGFVFLLASLCASWRAARRGDWASLLLAALMMALTVLTNWVAGLALAICTVLLITTMWGMEEFKPRRIIDAGVVGYGLSCFWLTPSFVYTMAFNWPQDAFGYKLQNAERLMFLGWLAGLALIRLLFVKFPKQRYYCFILSCLFAFGLMVSAFYAYNINTIPESRRYAIEFECFLILASVETVRVAVHSGKWWLRWPMLFTLLVTLLYLTPNTWKFLYNRWDKWQPSPKEQTVEYATAKRLNDTQHPGRVFVSGGTRFYLNSWFPEPQIGGVFETGLSNRMPVDMIYQIRTDILSRQGQEAENTIWQLRAMGVDYAVIHGPQSTEYYRDFKYPNKLDGVLRANPVANNDYLYELPYAPAALLVKDTELPTKPPRHGSMRLLEAYIKAMDDPGRPKLHLQWVDNNHFRVEGDFEEGYKLAVAVNYDAGWKAIQRSKTLPLGPNKIGFLTALPLAGPKGTVDFYYSAGWEPRFFALLSLVVWIAGIRRLWQDRKIEKE